MNEKIIGICNGIFPIFGGIGGAVSQIKDFNFLPHWESIVSAIIVAVIGAVVGYIVKMFLDFIIISIKRK